VRGAVAPLRLVLASGNPHKLEELRRAVPEWHIELVGRDDPPPEDGETYEENARSKARWGRLHAPLDAWVVGEDSGIEARALGGAPGVCTARWAAGDPVGRMLAALEGTDYRRARYRCVLVAIAPDGREIVAEGVLDGSIASAPAGAEGFGFDPVFVPDGERQTVAELGNDWKCAHSHRAAAAARLAGQLQGSD
jgi:XTP/dITP diphosphohydrolase